MTGDPDPSLRAADADRDAVADRLRVAHTEGRLTVEEFQQRLDGAFAARTMGDLAALTRDLPARPAETARTGDEAQPSRAVRPRPTRPPLAVVWGSWLTAVLVCTAIWAVVSLSEGDAGYFWPVWVAGPWGAVLLARTVLGGRR
jgi:hypothetical protein